MSMEGCRHGPAFLRTEEGGCSDCAREQGRGNATNLPQSVKGGDFAVGPAVKLTMSEEERSRRGAEGQFPEAGRTVFVREAGEVVRMKAEGWSEPGKMVYVMTREGLSGFEDRGRAARYCVRYLVDHPEQLIDIVEGVKLDLMFGGLTSAEEREEAACRMLGTSGLREALLERKRLDPGAPDEIVLESESDDPADERFSTGAY